ncbi:hypothetical protein MHL_2844 [Mesomycoplasma hyopneumoniae 7422]|nr:hypothetical protein MHL_2844 [Mesomycoplasma hyopneumoniae 7422]
MFWTKFSWLLALFSFAISIFENLIYYHYLQSLNFISFVSLNSLSGILLIIFIFLTFLDKIAPIFWKNSLLKDVKFQKDICNFYLKKNNRIYFILIILSFISLIIFNLYNLIEFGITYYSFGLVLVVFLVCLRLILELFIPVLPLKNKSLDIFCKEILTKMPFLYYNITW